MTTLGNDIKALKQQMNLQVLQRSFGVDTIHSIEHTFDHVVLYEYNSKKKEWKKKQVEGTCFIVRRKDQSVSLVIMNRLNVNNFVLLMNEQSVQVGYQAPYFFIQTNSNNNSNNSNNNSIYGLWFYREQNANQLMQFCQEHIFKSSSIINQSSSSSSSSVEDETKTSMLLSQMFDSVKQQQQTTTNGSLSNNNTNGTTTNGIVQAMMMQSTQQQPHHHHHHVNPHSHPHHHPMMMMNGASSQQPQQHHGVVVPAHSPINGVSSSASVSSSPDMLEQISKLSGFTLNRQNTTNVSTTSTPTPTTTTSAPVNQTNYNRGVTAATAAVTTTANKPVRLDPKKSLLTPECLMRGLEQSKK